jgi:hypothetical protein
METQAEITTHNTGIDEEGKEMYDGGRERKRREGRGGENQRRCSRASPPIRPFCYLFAFPRRELGVVIYFSK